MKIIFIDGTIMTIHEMENKMLEYKEIEKILDKLEITNTKSNINKIRTIVEVYEKVKRL